jgi:hypothetical protein
MKGNLDRASELVYEAVTGKCWHRKGTVIYRERELEICEKCKHLIRNMSRDGGRHGPWYDYVISLKRNNYRAGSWKVIDRLPNPPLATSLDAWAEHIWPVMDDEIKVSYISTLGIITSPCWPDCPNGIACNYVDWNQQVATPLHHLEAALRALNLYDTWREGE